MIKVNQHALIHLVYSYMVTKVFNIQPVFISIICHLLWFKKQSFTLVLKPNPPLLSLLRAPSRSCWCSEYRLYPRKLHLFTWSVRSDSCYNMLWLCSVQTQTCTSATTSIFFYWGGGVVVRLTAKPRYLLLLHRGKEKSNTVTALRYTASEIWATIQQYQHHVRSLIRIQEHRLKQSTFTNIEHNIYRLQQGLIWLQRNTTGLPDIKSLCCWMW